MEEILKKPPPTLPPPYVPAPLLTKKEIETERDKANDDFIKIFLQMSKDELDALNESANQKNKKIRRDIIDPTPGLFIDDKLNPNEQNLQNKQITFLIFQLRYNSSLMKMSLKKL